MASHIAMPPSLELDVLDAIMPQAIENLKSVDILVHKPGEEEYERSVATANLLYRFARPHCVVQPKFIFHVQHIINLAKRGKIPITIKNGGHSYAGFSTAEKGILLDLVKMNKVSLDMNSERKTVTLGGGARWGDAYKLLINGHHDGYVINGGRCPTVGVSGFILGGGLGPFTRSLGMGCDTLQEATIITADGEGVIVKASDPPNSRGGKLFWALRGAGGGNFGVVVEMKMDVLKLQNEQVVAGKYIWYPELDEKVGDKVGDKAGDKAEDKTEGEMKGEVKDKVESEAEGPKKKEFLATMEKFYTTNWPDEMTIDSTWICEAEKAKSELGVRFLVYYDGDKPTFDNIIDASIDQMELKKELKRRTLPEPSTRFLHETLVQQWSEETKKAFPLPDNCSYMIYTSFVFENDDKNRIKKIASTIRDEMRAFRALFLGERAQFSASFIHSGGKAKEEPCAPEGKTAYPWRRGTYHMYITIQWYDKWVELNMRCFFRKLKEKLTPYSIEGQAVYINFADRTLGSDYEKVYYGSNYLKLRQVKRLWDEDNFFNWVQSIQLPKVGPTNGNLIANSHIESISIATHVKEKEPLTEEKRLTDAIATEQWKTFRIPENSDFSSQGIYDLGIRIPKVYG